MAPPSWMLIPRSITGDIESVPQTFSSWHNCMQKTYCKWPAIIGIIIASLIVFSIVWCCARCLCCGLSCCCDCFSCLACCESCCARRKSPRSKYADGPLAFAPYQGYQPAPNPPAYEPPKFASFDAPSKKGNINDDSLPAMPSWDTATSRRIEETSPHEDMEMNTLRTGVSAHAPQASGGPYSEIPDQSASHYGNGSAEYRGAGVTHPYGSDLGAQRLAAEETGYSAYSSGLRTGTSYAHGPSYSDRSPNGVDTSYSGALPYGSDTQSGYVQQRQDTNFYSSSPAPTYHTYAPTQPYSPTDSTRYAPTTAIGSMNISPAQARPPSLLQVGRKPLPRSGREV